MSGKKLEAWIKRYHYRLELIRTIVPLILLSLQVAILYKLYH